MDTICFDLDGTLTDPAPGITACIRHALTELTGDAPPAEDLLWCIGPPLLGSFETLLAGKGDAARALVLYRERFGDVGMFENRVYDGMPETLSALSAAGYRMVVASSKPAVYVRQIVGHFGLADYFDAVHGSELDGTRADKSDLLSWVIAEEGIAAERATMIGDRHYDIRGARNNGLRAVGVLYGYGSEAELTEAGAHTVCRSPDELAPLFEASPPMTDAR